MKKVLKSIVECLIVCVLTVAFWFRYRVTYKGVENLTPENLKKPGGILFLPNHVTVLIDSALVVMALWPKYSLRPMVVEYMYYLPVVNSIMRLLDALPVPNFGVSSNSLKRKKNERIFNTVIEALKEKENFLLFPAGRLKHTNYEAIDGASGTQQIIQSTPEANIVLVRVKGLWGSSFSRAQTGKTPPLFASVIQGIKTAFKNLLFFSPRREVIVEFVPAPADFPYKADRMEMNKYLERWYNQPDHLTDQKGPSPGDSLMLVPYSMWDKKDLPKVYVPESQTQAKFDLEKIPEEIQKKVIAKLTEISGMAPDTIKPQMSLTADLCLDSLDVADLTAYLQDQFEVENPSIDDLNNVGKLMAIAAHQVACSEAKEEEDAGNLSEWYKPVKKSPAQFAEGKTIPEVFLNNCDRMGNAVACTDLRTGILTYSQVKLRIILLANHIRTLPGKYIGIMLPASVTASMTILACQLAGKVPLMVNWTVGSRHLQAVAQLSQLKVVLSSWTFLDRLQNVDLDGIEDELVMLEDVKNQISLTDKIKAYLLSKRSAKAILNSFNFENITAESEAVLLFTSGTESLPKGVPLSHQNILANQRACMDVINLYSNDIIYGILPPFHSFGFTIGSLLGLLSGVKVAFSPDPTAGKQLARGFERWKITVVCGAPTFIKKILKAAKPEQLKTMRLCIVGAEKMPQELVQAIEKLGKDDGLLEGYGITECAPALTYTRQGEPRVGVGKPLPGVDICIINHETHVLLPQGEQGLILARGQNIFSGYLNPGLASPFITVEGREWYNTGDLGYLDLQGNLVLSDRMKRFVKVGGEMVSLASIEQALAHLAAEKGCTSTEDGPILAISGKEVPGNKPDIVLFCRFSTSTDEANKALREAGFSNLVKVNSVIQLDEIPIMGSGKINYRALDTLKPKAQNHE
jgi:long-chain-fatty-acid--[acyl-carrier-protein] ligase